MLYPRLYVKALGNETVIHYNFADVTENSDLVHQRWPHPSRNADTHLQGCPPPGDVVDNAVAALCCRVYLFFNTHRKMLNEFNILQLGKLCS